MGGMTIGRASKKLEELDKQDVQNMPANNQPPTSMTPHQVAPITSSSDFNLQAELKKAAKMLEDGLIDEEEYKAVKKKLVEKS
jgi:hypothetical protein